MWDKIHHPNICNTNVFIKVENGITFYQNQWQWGCTLLIDLDTMSSCAFEHNGKGISLCKLFHIWKA